MRAGLPWLIFAAAPFGAAALSGCSKKPAPVEACEAVLMPKLKSPSTYKLIDFTLGLETKGGTQDVFLNYDAVNAYNAPIRSLFWCSYNSVTERAEEHKDNTTQADNMDAIAGSLGMPDAEPPAPRATPVPDPKPTIGEDTDTEEVPVCDRPDSEEKFALMNEIGTDCTGE